MVDLNALFASYVPPLVASRLATDPRAGREPLEERFPAAALFADISGFTPLVEHLVRRGPGGVEEISRLLGAYFGRFTDIVLGRGGQVVQFAGDALFSLWPAETGNLAAETARAAACARILVDELNGVEAADGVRLFLKAGLGAGEIWAGHLGGVASRWLFLAAGSPAVQMNEAEKHAGPGDVVLSPQAWDLVKDTCTGLSAGDQFMKLTAIEGVTSGSPSPSSPVPHHALERLRGYVPEVVTLRADAGQAEWLAELRRIAVLFLNVTDLDYGERDILAQAQNLMQTVQRDVARLGGSVVHLRMDHQGTTCMAAFGTPPLAHEGVRLRAMQAAAALQEALAGTGLHSTIGVTSGRAFCGPVGGAARREYTVFGDAVNLAARLMQAAREGDALCDGATQEAAQGRIHLERLPAFSLKGVADPVPVYRIRTEGAGDRRDPLIGRAAEQASMGERLQSLRDGVGGGALLLEGAAGIGKSRLVRWVCAEARQMELSCLVGEADPIEHSTPYRGWRPIFQSLMGLSADDAATRVMRVTAHLQSCPELLDLAPLLNPIVLAGLPESATTCQMSGEVRADNTQALLLKLLDRAAGARPLVLVLDDAHWLDTASWSLCLRVCRELSGVLLVVASRPMGDLRASGYADLLHHPGTVHISLDGLSGTETRQLLSHRLGVTGVAEALAEVIDARAEGNPFFVEELASAMRDEGQMAVRQGICELASGQLDPAQMRVPETVQGVMTNRIDNLPPAHQLALKVASVLGRHFTAGTLREIYPLDTDREKVPQLLQSLELAGLIVAGDGSPELSYWFRHQITQEVAYDLLLMAQRRALHERVATWYEVAPDGLAPGYAVMAHHWREGGVASKAVDYLEKAGQQALEEFANKEAALFFRQAIDLAGTAAVGVEPRRWASWELQLGTASVSLRDYRAGQHHLETGLSLLGLGVPRHPLALALAVGGGVLRQVGRRLRSARFAPRDGARREMWRTGSRAYERLVEVYYFAGAELRSLYAAFRGLNLAEEAGISPELARGYATVGALLGFVPLRRAAERYLTRALDTLVGQGDRGAEMWVSTAVSYYHAGVGNWDGARRLLDSVVAQAEELGDRRTWEDGLANLAAIHCLKGQFSSGLEVAEMVCRGPDSSRSEAAGLSEKTQCLLYLGELAAASACLDGLEDALIADSTVPNEALRMEAAGIAALLYLRRGEPEAALEAARKAEGLLARSPSHYSTLIAYGAVCEVYLTTAGLSDSASGSRRRCRRACRLLRGYARVFPIGMPRHCCWQGLLYWRSGRRRKAQATWERGLSAAARLGMGLEEGFASYLLGHHLSEGHARRIPYLRRALATFEEIGARAEADLARAEMGSAGCPPGRQR